MSNISVRRAEVDDSELINDLIEDPSQSESQFGMYDVLCLIENSVLSITAVDDTGIIGFAAFSDIPRNRTNEWFSRFPELFDAPGHRPSNTLWLSFFVAKFSYEMEVAEQILRTAFTTLPQIDYVAYLLPELEPTFSPIQDAFLELEVQDGEFERSRAFSCARSLYIPTLNVRRARVEDYDDLVVVFDSQSQDLTEQYGEFFLAELIEAQDDANKALVAEVDDRTVGLLSLTSDVDIAVLQQCFELAPFGNLVKGGRARISSGAARERRFSEASDGSESKANDASEPSHSTLRAVVCGPRGSGKGVVSEAVSRATNAVIVSAAQVTADAVESGELQREELSKFVESGEQIPDELLGPLIVSRITEADCMARGWVIDGFPCSATGATLLFEQDLAPNLALILEASDDTCFNRVAERRIDPVTGDIFTLDSPAPADITSRLIQMPRDTPEYLEACLASWAADSVDLLNVLQSSLTTESEHADPLCKIDASLDIAGVLSQVVNATNSVLQLFARSAPTSRRQSAADNDFSGAKGSSHTFDLDESGQPDSLRSNGLSFPALDEAEEEDDEGYDVPASNRVGQLATDSLAQGTGESAAFAITLFCLDEMFESRARDFLSQAFEEYADLEYCLLTLPHSAPESALLSCFTQVAPQPGANFSHVLYLFHRDALLAPSALSVRLLDPDDFPAVATLARGLPATPALMRDLESCCKEAEALGLQFHGDCDPSEAAMRVDLDDNGMAMAMAAQMGSVAKGVANPSKAAFVLECDGQLVAVAVADRSFTDSEGVAWSNTAFNTQELVSFAHHPDAAQATLLHLVVNPIFTRSTRFFLQQLMRLYRKTLLYYRCYPRKPVLPVLNEMVQAKPRTQPQLRPSEQMSPRSKLEDENGGFCLYFLTRKLLGEPKLVNNTRVVVVGASNTGLAFLETLLLVPYLHFTQLTLLAPEGLAMRDRLRLEAAARSHGTLMSDCGGLTARQLERLGMGARVRIIESHLVDLDRESQAVLLPGDSILLYDVLVLATGLQEHSAHLIEHVPDPMAIQGFHSLCGPFSSAAADLAVRDAEIEHGVFVIYGRSLTALVAVQSLIARGIPPDNIHLIRPCNDGFSSSPLADDFVHGMVLSALRETGVVVRHGLVLSDVVVEPGALRQLCGVVFSPRAELREESKLAGVQSVELAASVLLCCDEADVDSDLFHAVNESGLVYDGRLVVDHRFRTADAAIYAGGSLSKFSRRLRVDPPLEQFNSQEVGERMAQAVLMEIDPLADGLDFEEAESVQMPSLTRPKVQSGVLPGGFHYLHVKAVPPFRGDHRRRIGGTVESGRTLETKPDMPDGKLRYCRLQLSWTGRVLELIYLGHDPVESQNLARLVGMQESFLNSLLHFFDAGGIPDLVEYFRQDWAVALYHDRFSQFCEALLPALESTGDEGVSQVVARLREAVDDGLSSVALAAKRRELVGVAGKRLPPRTRHFMENRLIEFLANNQDLLPMYFQTAADQKGEL